MNPDQDPGDPNPNINIEDINIDDGGRANMKRSIVSYFDKHIGLAKA
jgi:hypothetical protein